MNKWFIKITKTCIDKNSDFYGTITERVIGKSEYNAGFKIIHDCGGYGNCVAQFDTARYGVYEHGYTSINRAWSVIKKVYTKFADRDTTWNWKFDVIEL